MNIRWPWAMAAGVAVFVSVSMLAAESKKTKGEKGKTAAETNTTVNVTTNNSKPPIDLKVYKLCPSDVVEIRVFREDDLTTKGRIAKDGTITVHLLGIVTIGGQTVEQAAHHIEELLKKDYLVNPHVSVSVLEYAKKWFHVVGQVNRQGSYPIPEEETMDLDRAIALAGGFTSIAKKSELTVIRMVGDEKKNIIVDLKARERNKNAKPFEILPDDTIKVHESAF